MATIQGIYVALFGRPADPLGLEFYKGVTGDGADLSKIADLSNSAEYQDRFEGKNSVQIVNSIYQALFNRDADAAGLAYFVAELNSGRQNINTIAINILDGAQGVDITTVNNKIAAADAFTAALDTGSEIAGYQGDDAAEQGRLFLRAVGEDESTVPTPEQVDAAVERAVNAGEQTTADFTLTPGQDFADASVAFRNGPIAPIESDFRFTSGNERVSASTATLTNGDVLTDSSTSDKDVLNVSVSGSVNPISNARVTNIENINLALTSASGTFNLGNYVGVQELQLDGTIVQTSGTDLFTVSNIANSGLSVIDASGVAAGAHQFDGIVVNSAAANQSITFTGHAGRDSVILGNGDNVIDLGAGNNDVTLGNGDNTVKGGDQADQLVAGNGDNTIDAGNGNNLVVVGNGDNTITSGSGVDLITVGTGDNIVTSGGGNDTITKLAGSGSLTVTAGAGADVINLGAGGDDNIILSSTDTGLGAAADRIFGFETGADTIDFTDLAAGTADNYREVAGGANAATALAAANNVFANPVTDITYVFTYGAGGGHLFVDTDNDGSADVSITLTGLNNANGFAFSDIV